MAGCHGLDLSFCIREQSVLRSVLFKQENLPAGNKFAVIPCLDHRGDKAAQKAADNTVDPAFRIDVAIRLAGAVNLDDRDFRLPRTCGSKPLSAFQ